MKIFFKILENLRLTYITWGIKWHNLKDIATLFQNFTHHDLSGGLHTKLLQLHWLQVKHRVHYKVLLIVHKCITKNAPDEVMALLSHGDSARTGHLAETRCMSKYGERAFSHYGPKIWNLLPKDIRLEVNTCSFKKKLKTYLIVSGEDMSQRLDCQ